MEVYHEHQVPKFCNPLSSPSVFADVVSFALLPASFSRLIFSLVAIEIAHTSELCISVFDPSQPSSLTSWSSSFVLDILVAVVLWDFKFKLGWLTARVVLLGNTVTGWSFEGLVLFWPPIPLRFPAPILVVPPGTDTLDFMIEVFPCEMQSWKRIKKIFNSKILKN